MLTTELVHRRSRRTWEEVEKALFANIDSWYDTERIQAGSGGAHPTSTRPHGEPDHDLVDDHAVADITGTGPVAAR